jgi:hypothetical protein
MFNFFRKLQKPQKLSRTPAPCGDDCESRSPAPCGDDRTHYYWVERGWPCPECMAQRARIFHAKEEEKKRNKLEASEDRLVEKIATEVVKRLQESKLV